MDQADHTLGPSSSEIENHTTHNINFNFHVPKAFGQMGCGYFLLVLISVSDAGILVSMVN